MSDTPIVSIVVPAYNGERHIRQCVDSVQTQTIPATTAAADGLGKPVK